MKKIIAKTFTPSYDPVEDRIRLSINYADAHQRIDFMITRAFIIELLFNSTTFYEVHTPDKQTDNRRNNTNEEIKENTAHTKTDMQDLQLYRSQESLLREVNFSYIQEQNIYVVTFREEKKEATAKLSPELFYEIFKVLDSVVPHAQWGLSPHYC